MSTRQAIVQYSEAFNPNSDFESDERFYSLNSRQEDGTGIKKFIAFKTHKGSWLDAAHLCCVSIGSE